MRGGLTMEKLTQSWKKREGRRREGREIR